MPPPRGISRPRTPDGIERGGFATPEEGADEPAEAGAAAAGEGGLETEAGLFFAPNFGDSYEIRNR